MCIFFSFDVRVLGNVCVNGEVSVSYRDIQLYSESFQTTLQFFSYSVYFIILCHYLIQFRQRNVKQVDQTTRVLTEGTQQ